MITHDIDETRSDDLRWSLCGVFLYDEKQLPHGDEPATCRKCQRYRSATSYLKRREAMKTAKKTAKKTWPDAVAFDGYPPDTIGAQGGAPKAAAPPCYHSILGATTWKTTI